MKKILGLALIFSLAACGDAATNEEKNNSDTLVETDPAIMQPPADALPDSMQLKNDSVIVADSSGKSLREGTRHDSL